ncbi:Squalene synthase [Acidithiobacillus sp. GGI-221]|nr:Squalene synthase [Acidithiobacillus sp. GGI-221]
MTATGRGAQIRVGGIGLQDLQNGPGIVTLPPDDRVFVHTRTNTTRSLDVTRQDRMLMAALERALAYQAQSLLFPELLP